MEAQIELTFNKHVSIHTSRKHKQEEQGLAFHRSRSRAANGMSIT
jgi:hypothetical protein